MFVFINEGFYSEMCSTSDNKLHNVTLLLDKESDQHNVIFEGGLYNTSTDIGVGMRSNCADQESRLGLWFSIGVGCTWGGMAVLGPLSKALGTRITRIIIL